MEAKSYRGKTIDMNALLMKHEKDVALGNSRLNARGDLLGPGGKVIKKREDLIREYHDQDPKAVKKVSIHEDPKADAKIEQEFIEEAKLQEKPKAKKPKSENKIDFS